MYDLVVIGSGFGGSVAASRLSAAGKKVCLLERGPWREGKGLDVEINKAPLPIGYSKMHYFLRSIHRDYFPRVSAVCNPAGLFEMFNFRDVNVVCSSGVGGGSHVYGGLHARPFNPKYWDAVSCHLTHEQMESYYREMLTLFDSKDAPQRSRQPVFDMGGSLQEITVADQPKWGYRPGKKDEDWFIEAKLSSEGMSGSPEGNKMTLDRRLLQHAMKDYGLEIRALCDVSRIKQQGDGFSISYLNLEKNQDEVIEAKQLVLAAGCVNTVKLLMQSVADNCLSDIPALGKGFSSNADIMAIWRAPNEPDETENQGPYQRLFKPINSIHEYVILQTPMFGLDSFPIPAWLKNILNAMLSMASMGVDSSSGEISLKKGKLSIRYREQDNPVLGEIRQVFKEIENSTRTKIHAAPRVTTVHPMGGCVIADDSLSGVVDAFGECHQVKNLFIADASVFPKALGSAPSLSISAWAAYVADGILKKGKS